MKKSNLFTFMLLGVSILFVIIGVGAKNKLGEHNKSTMVVANAASHDISKVENTEQKQEQNQNATASDTTQKTEVVSPEKVEEVDPGTVSMEDALFIGDSRTVGLMEYGQMEEPDYFCNVGMSVFNVQKETVSVPNVGKVTLSQLLENKQYGKIYIMLGINELGYPYEKLISKYEEVLEYVKEKAPTAKIILQANLHVTKSRSDRDDIYNNTIINKLNSALSEYADNKRIYFIDVNPVFDDQNGALSADKSSDETHLYGKYYAEWTKWIVQQTAAVLKEG